MTPLTAATASQAALASDAKVLAQASFYCALLFLAVYSARTPWWRTVHGRTLAALAAAVIAVLLRTILTYWGAASPGGRSPGALDWITTNAQVLVPLAFLTMTWQLVRKPVRRWLRNRLDDDPLAPEKPDREKGLPGDD